MSIATRRATIEQAFDLRSSELRCQIARASLLDTFLASANRAAAWQGMTAEGRRLLVSDALGRAGFAVTDAAIALGIAKYEAKYGEARE
jgi:hypothetical protein